MARRHNDKNSQKKKNIFNAEVAKNAEKRLKEKNKKECSQRVKEGKRLFIFLLFLCGLCELCVKLL